MAPGRKQPTHLRGASSRKGKKYTTAQLAANKQRVELTLKQKCDVIIAPKSGFLMDSVESTLVRVNQTMFAKQFNVTKKTLCGVQRSSSNNFLLHLVIFNEIVGSSIGP